MTNIVHIMYHCPYHSDWYQKTPPASINAHIICAFSSPRVVQHLLITSIEHLVLPKNNSIMTILFSYTNNIWRWAIIDHILQLGYKPNNWRLLPIGRRGCSFARCRHTTRLIIEEGRGAPSERGFVRSREAGQWGEARRGRTQRYDFRHDRHFIGPSQEF